MTLGYKLMTKDMQTHGGYQWELGEWREATGVGTDPCSDGVLHYYSDPLLAVLHNPIHADIAGPILVEIEVDRDIGTDGLKSWCKRQKPIKVIPLPEITTAQRVRYAIYCYQATPDKYHVSAVDVWAEKWLDGSDRGQAAARAAWAEAAAARAALAEAAAAWAEAAEAWEVEAWEVKAAWAAEAARAASVAAWAAAWAARAARAAAWAAEAARAAEAAVPIDFAALAHRAIEEERGGGGDD